MQQQTLKNIPVGGLIVSETADGSTVVLDINNQTTCLTREDFNKLCEAGKELFAREIKLKCGLCGREMTGKIDLSANTAILTIDPCEACARKEPTDHENT